MTEANEINSSNMFDVQLPTVDERLELVYKDPIVRQRFADIMHTPVSERAGLQAQLTTYVAAAYALFPEESQIIHDSLERLESYER